MKRNVILTLIMICLLSLAACGGGKEDAERQEGYVWRKLLFNRT